VDPLDRQVDGRIVEVDLRDTATNNNPITKPKKWLHCVRPVVS
jgi:hypothetical protein